MKNEEAARILEYPVHKWSMDWDEREDGLSYCEAIEKAIAALRNLQSTCNIVANSKPLTIEQLREMANKPYWHVGLRSESADPHWKILDPFIARFPEDYGYGKRWLAYAYPPARIDREAWEPCEDCKSCDTCGQLDPRKCKQCRAYEHWKPKFKYCKNCGRPLTEEAWAELEKRMGVRT